MISTGWLTQKELHTPHSKKGSSSSFIHSDPRHHHPVFDVPSDSSVLSSTSTSSSTTAAGQDSSPTSKDIHLHLQTHRHYDHVPVRSKVPFTLTIPRRFPTRHDSRHCLSPPLASEQEDPSYPSICLDGRQSCTSSYRQHISYVSSTIVVSPTEPSTAITSPRSFLALPHPPRRAPPPVPTGLTAFVTHTTSPLDEEEDPSMGLRHQRHHPHAHNPRELKQYWPSSRHIATTPNRHPHQYLKPHEVLARKMSRTLRFSNDKKKKPRYSYVKASEVRLHQQQQQQQQQQQTLQIPRQSLVEADGSVAGSKSCKDHTGRKRFRAATPTTTTGSSRVFTNQSGTTGKSSLMQGLVGWINTRMRTRQAKKQKRPLQSVCDDDEDAFADRIDLVQQQQHHHHHQQHEQEQPHMPISIATMMPRPVQTETDLGPSTMRHHSPLRQSPLCQPSVETLRARETQAQEYARTIKALWQMAEEEEQAYQLAVEQHEWTDEGATTATASEVGGDDLQSQHQASTEAAAITPSATSVVHTGRDDFWQWHSGARTSIQHQTRFGAGHLYYQERQAQRRKEAEGKQEQAEESEMMDVEGGESKAATKERNGALLFEQPQRSKASTPDREPRDNDDDMEEEEEQEEAQVLYRLQMQYGKWQGGLCLDVPGLTRARTHTASTTDGYQYDKSFESQSLGQTNVGGIDGHGYYDIDVDDAEEIEGHLAMERALQSRVQLESVEESEKKGVQPQQPQQANAMHSGSLTRATRASVVRPRVVVLESEGELDLASTKRRIQAQREQQRRWNGW